MKVPLRVLLVEDSSDDALLMVRELRRSNYDVSYVQVDSAEAMRAALDRQNWDIVLSDYSIPEFGALLALRLVQERKLDIPFIIVSGTVGEDTAVVAMKAGAHDFFAKANLARLVPAIERELRDADERRRRRLAEEQLALAEMRFTTAFQASPVGIAILTVDGQILDVNRLFLQLFGYDRNHVIGQSLVDLLLVADSADRSRIQQAINEQQSIHDEEIECQTHSGLLRDMLVSLVSIDLGMEPGRLSLFHDITERKQAQNELIALYNAISYLFNADSLLNLGRQIVDGVVKEFGKVDCGLVLIDKAQARLTEFARSGEQQAQIDEQTPSFDRPGLVTTAIKSGTIIYAPDVNADARYFRTDARTQSELVIPLRTPKGVLGALDLQSQDLDAFNDRDQRILAAFAERAAAAIESMQLYEELNRHAAQLEKRVVERTRELQQAKEHVEAILENSSDMIIVVGSDGTIQQANPAFRNTFAYDDEVYGQLLVKVIETDSPDTLATAVQGVIATGEPARVELTCRHRDGTQFNVDAAFAPVRQNLLQEINILCSLRDITERKQLEAGLRAALAREKELNELKSRFVSMVSHEFRTPLASIQSSTELVSHYADRMDETRKQEHFGQIIAQVSHLTDLLDDVLTIGRADFIALQMNAVLTRIDQFCRELIDEMTVFSSTHPVELAITGDCLEVPIDPKLMRQIIMNLLSNAFKYSHQGAPVEFDLRCEDDQFVLRVKDQGIGIPAEDQPHLFENFHRGNNVGTTPGTGLGLAIVKRAVEAHRGTIGVESAVGKGTTFVVSIPIRTA